MNSVEDVKPAVKACLENAEKLYQAAKAAAKPGSYHIVYHLAVLALEEIGKSSMVFMSALNPLSTEDHERKGPAKWIDDHERKLFWAIWLPRRANFSEWKTIPESMEIARTVHNNRLNTLYVDPANLGASSIDEEEALALLSLTESRIEMEKLKELRDLDDESAADLLWFFTAMDSPTLRPMVFSKGSLDKQSELGDDHRAWIKWLRETVEEGNRRSVELMKAEMQRVPKEGADRFKDKFEIKLRLKSWSHSIRPNQLKWWNTSFSKIQLVGTSERNELTLNLRIPQMIKTQDLWNAGWQSAYVFITALNVGTMGFFWWYLPEFTSRYYEKMHDLEHNCELVVERVPELKMSWGHLALKSEDLSNVAVVFGFLAYANQQQFQASHRYFQTLGLLAKNDIFFQFEPNIVSEFVSAFRDAMTAYGDWDGRPETFEDSVNAFFGERAAVPNLLSFAKDSLEISGHLRAQTSQPKPVTLEDVGKAKVCFDIYIRVKAQRHFQKEVSEMR